MIFRPLYPGVPGRGGERAGVPAADDERVLERAPPLLPQPRQQASHRWVQDGGPWTIRQPFMRPQLRDAEMVRMTSQVDGVCKTYHW